MSVYRRHARDTTYFEACDQILPANHKNAAKIDSDHSGTIDGREAADLLGKSGLTREQLKTVWELADKNDRGELDHDEWAVAMHLSRRGGLGRYTAAYNLKYEYCTQLVVSFSPILARYVVSGIPTISLRFVAMPFINTRSQTAALLSGSNMQNIGTFSHSADWL